MSTVSARKLALLQWEACNIQDFLDDFDAPAGGESRSAHLGRTGEILIVKNFPLPDRCRPDQIDLFVGVPDYPASPPIGLYVLNRHNENLIVQLRHRFNIFRDHAYHEADPVPGYTWICYAYAENVWRYNAAAPAKGDNVRKFLSSFFATLEN